MTTQRAVRPRQLVKHTTSHTGLFNFEVAASGTSARLGIVPRYAISRYFSAVRQARKLPCISLGWAHPTSAMSPAVRSIFRCVRP